MESFMRYLPDLLVREVEEGRAAVAGGAIRSHFEGVVPTDVDVFVFSREDYERIFAATGAVPVPGTDRLVGSVPGTAVPVEVVFQSEVTNATTYAAFVDFDIASGFYSAGRLHFAPSFPEAIQSKKMRYLGGVGTAQRSYARSLKYGLKYGYTMDSSIGLLLSRWREEVAAG